MASPRKTTARIVAASALAEVIRTGCSLDAALAPLQERLENPRDRALAREIASGTARWYFELKTILDRLVERPVRQSRVRAVLMTGLYQLRHTRIPSHAAISESVETVRRLGQPRAAGLINAVLRRYQRETDACNAAVAASPVAQFATPGWLVESLRKDWPDDSDRLLRAGNERAPMWLRINRRRTDRDSYLSLLAEQADQAGKTSPFCETAVRLEAPLPVDRVPGFSDGLVSVQDAGAQLAAGLLDLEPGMRVLDACAAPGGKTCHILESTDVAVTAVDNDAARLERVQENLSRLGLDAALIAGDAGNPADWWDGRPFDRILLDVPCSATGVMRRHPDIKLLRRAGDVPVLAAQQASLLQAAWPMLAGGGRLVYATCSVLRAENSGVLTTFLDAQPGANARTIAADWGRKDGPGRQILTGEAGMDGFYYSCLEAR